jgi:hypothetical protein
LDRQQRLEDIINRRMAAAGLPPVAFGAGNFQQHQLGYQMGGGNILLNASHFQGNSPPTNLIKTAYHEARHAEQDYRAGQYLASQPNKAGRRTSAADISKGTGMNESYARHSAARARGPTSSPEGVFGKAMHESMYGSRANHRAQIITDMQNKTNDAAEDGRRFQNYQNLVEEIDARAAEDLTNGCP